MNKEHDPKITVALITGGLGCLGTICAALIGGWFAIANSKGSSTVIIIPTNPPAITQVIPTQPETTFTVINETSIDICYLYIMPNDEGTSWGENWLTSDGPIKPKKGLIFTIDTGMYDYQAVDCQGQVVEEVYGDHLQGAMTWVVDGQ